MTALKAVIDALKPVEDGWRGTVPEAWLQGRTVFGGMSAALALHAAQRSEEDLPPLRSAQIAFVGPLAGRVALRAVRLRRGRNAAFVQVDVAGDAGLGLRATFVFMGAVDSTVDYRVATAPAFARPGPGTQAVVFPDAIRFARNFELLEDRGAAVGPAEWVRWARLRERDGLDPMVELMCVADCLPPGALKLVGGPAPVSSMTWLLNVLGPPPRTDDGWWLLRANTGYASGGGSSQQMAIWNAAGEPVAEQMQSIAIFA